MAKLLCFAFLLLQLAPQKAAAVDVAKTPPMGWSSWCTFGKEINKALIHQAAEAIITTGMNNAGYSYINLDVVFLTLRAD